jgi:hypothetical protein
MRMFAGHTYFMAQEHCWKIKSLQFPHLLGNAENKKLKLKFYHILELGMHLLGVCSL